jgi:hypothetical protein
VTDTPALLSSDEAKELLGHDDFVELVSNGEVRRLKTPEGNTVFLGADVDRALRDKRPRSLAAAVPRL